MNNNLARQQMVAQQVRVWDVSNDRVLAVLAKVERERFVPAGFENVAYADTEIPLPHGQVMLRPIIEGRLLQALAPAQDERVLDVGTGSGYLAACLARMCHEVVSIDVHGDFVDAAKRSLDEGGYRNVELQRMDATVELPPGTFDAIAVSASLPAIDERFIAALKDGGRLFVVVGKSPLMRALLITRDGADWHQQRLFETDIPGIVDQRKIVKFLF